MNGPLEPVDLDSLIFTTIAGEQRIGQPNGRERQLAHSLLADPAWRSGLGETALATVLAAVREGSTVEGPRQRVGATVTVSRCVIEGTGGDAERSATRAVWRRWSDELHVHGLRPIGWPTVQRTHLAFGRTIEDDPAHPERRGLTVVGPDADWALLELRLECEGVPAR